MADSDDDSLLVDVDIAGSSRPAPSKLGNGSSAHKRTVPAASDSGIVDLTSDCEDVADTAAALQTAAAPQGAQRHDKRPRPAASGAGKPATKRPTPQPEAAARRPPAGRVASQARPLPDIAEPEQYMTAAERKRREAEEKKAAKAAERELKAARQEAEKREKARQKQLAKEEKDAKKKADQQARDHAKTVVRQKRGKLADQEIQVLLSTEMAMLPVGHQIMERLRAKQYDFTIAPAALAPLPCISWRRRDVVGGGDAGDISQSQAAAEAAEEIPYLLIYLKADEFVDQVASGGVESLLQQAAAAHPTCTLALLIDGYHHYVEQRERREYRQTQTAGTGAAQVFSRRPADLAIMQLVTRYPGVRHRIVHDAAQAAEHVQMLTRALANQPYKVQDMFLEIHGAGGESQASASLLTRHPLPPDRVPLYRALNYTPAMGPSAAHIVAQEYASLGALMSAFLDPSKSDAEKLKMISELQKPTENRKRVGPAAVQKLLRVLTATDPELLVQG